MTTIEQVVTFAVDLAFDQAWAFAQFLKRTGHSDYRRIAKDSDETYENTARRRKSARCAHRQRA